MKDKEYNKTVFPICLLPENRKCLVIGAGKVALRKIKSLLEAKADVTVIAPECEAEVRKLFSKEKIRFKEREFKNSDIEDMFVVFAATNDRGVNRKVLDSCNLKKVLCCCVDGNWTESDFVSPATFRESGLTISVSSGGKSCRRSRLIKETLVKHIEMANKVDMLVLGTSHNYLSLDKREAFHLNGEKLIATGKMISNLSGVHEFILWRHWRRSRFYACFHHC